MGPNKCLGYCDFAVGKYTSLIEEFVTIGKPIILFDDDLFPALYRHKRGNICKKLKRIKQKIF